MSDDTTAQRYRVLVVEDHEDSAQWLKVLLTQQGYDVTVAHDGRHARDLREQSTPDLVLLDVRLPDTDGVDLFRALRQAQPDLEGIVMTGHGSVPGAVKAIQAGAINYVEKPIDPSVLLALLEKAGERIALSAENRQLRRQLGDAQTAFGEMLSASPQMRAVFQLIKSVAPTDANVLLTGDNGTGKELVANALHANSRRVDGPLLKINCAAIPSELIESELFGYKRGAFTGAAADRVGLFEQARGGTLLLDEIGEMPAHLQAKLLRVLQERQARPLGGRRVVDLDFRLVSSTNCNLDEAVQQGRFREDLLFRINTVTIAIPALRDRREDLPLLAEFFLNKFRKQYNRFSLGMRADAREALLTHDWPGNVRELEHAIERAVIVASGSEIIPEDLPEAVARREHDAEALLGRSFLTLAEIERLTILRALEKTGGNKRAAASLLGLYRPTLYSKLRKYGLFSSGGDVGETPDEELETKGEADEGEAGDSELDAREPGEREPGEREPDASEPGVSESEDSDLDPDAKSNGSR